MTSFSPAAGVTVPPVGDWLEPLFMVDAWSRQLLVAFPEYSLTIMAEVTVLDPELVVIELTPLFTLQV